MKHFGNKIMPGAKMLETNGEYEDVLAFKNPDGTTIIVIANTTDTAQDIQLQLDTVSQPITASIDPNSFNTLTIKP